MIDLGFLRGQTFTVLGLGASGLATARALQAADVGVMAWDDSADRRAAAKDEGIPIAEPTTDALAAGNGLILSPGIPRAHPAPHPGVTAAIAAGRPILSDIDLLARAVPGARFLGITGTNGKSTTTALIGHLLHAAGMPVAVGGNLGPAALSLDTLPDGGWYVLELSSYQLETIDSVPWSIGVFLNFSADHLDRYPDLDAYAAAKQRLFSTMPPGATAIIGIDDETSRTIADRLRARADLAVLSISAQATGNIGGKVGNDAGSGPDIWVDHGWLHDSTDGTRRAVADISACPTLPGRHNHQNAAAAYAACRAAAVPAATIAASMSRFPGLAHRQQLVARQDGIAFVNDSKATNPEAAAKALSSYPAIFWLAGGLPKPGGFQSLSGHLNAVRGAFVFGTAAEDIRALAESRRIPVTVCETMEDATRQAHEAARAAVTSGAIEDAVVLLSPACASFDQFRSFEERGDRFIDTAQRLSANRNGGER